DADASRNFTFDRGNITAAAPFCRHPNVMERVMRKSARSARIALLGLLALPVGAVAKDRYFDSDGVTIRYVEHGIGEPVVLVHGGGAALEMCCRSGCGS